MDQSTKQSINPWINQINQRFMEKVKKQSMKITHDWMAEF